MSIKSIYLGLVADTSELFITSNTRESFLEQVAEMKLQHVHDLMGRPSVTQTILSVGY